MVLIGYEMNKNVYEKTEVVFIKMTWVRKKKTFGYETIGNHTVVKINENVSLNENFTSALSIGLGRICVWLSLTVPKTIKSCNMYNMNYLLLLVIYIEKCDDL